MKNRENKLKIEEKGKNERIQKMRGIKIRKRWRW